MSLKPLTQPEITAARLREMANEMILQAEALEAGFPKPRRTSREVKIITRDKLFIGARNG